ncbi:hypothetical protein [Pseudogemmobacter sonorensis]|uniref:hypothetical protein n=1 Tax=Pseudogemmobacter sonorensis TaxID=2989681 RepID=UPI00367F4C34
MADPLTLAEFFSGLKISKVSFHLPGVRQHSRTAGGEVLSAVIGASLWRGTVTLAAGYHRSISAVQAVLEDLDRAGDPFLAHAMPVWAPAYDPTGSILNGYTPVLSSVAGDNHRCALSGLPPGYRLAQGEMLAFTYGTGPVRYALHRVRSLSVAASQAGTTGLFDVVPHIRPGWATGTAVTLIRPACKAVILPGSIRWPNSAPLISEGISFDFIQTLR